MSALKDDMRSDHMNAPSQYNYCNILVEYY